MTSSTLLHPLPTRSQLIKATFIAMVVAGLLLLTTVLPAEYGIDPTGIGKKLGLYGMSVASASAPEPAVGERQPASPTPPVAPTSPTSVGSAFQNQYVMQSLTLFRSGQMSVTLAPSKGAEIKARMRKGEQFAFSWTADNGVVEFDMHGEEVNAAKDVFTSYWMDTAGNAAGTFTAPFDGSHGWYWHNNGNTPITVTVDVSGFYSELYRP
jgi:hypothetical protein